MFKKLKILFQQSDWRNILKVLIPGLVIIGLSIILLWWNEGNVVAYEKGFTEANDAAVELSSPTLDDVNEGKLIHFIGKLESEEVLYDPDFNFSYDGLKMIRKVEMYQWVEDSHEEPDTNRNGDETFRTVYTYSKNWVEGLVVNKFQEKVGHVNPTSLPYSSKEIFVKSAHIGDFNISESQMILMEDFINFVPDSINQIISNDFNSNKVYIAPEGNRNYQVGDIKVTYKVLPEETYTVLAKQHQNTIEPFITETNTEIEMINRGKESLDIMIRDAKKRNKFIMWLLRFVGMAIMFFGFGKIFFYIDSLIRNSSYGNKIASVNSTALIFGLTLGVSLIIISLAWVVARPILAYTLLGIAVAAFIFVYIYENKK